MKGTGEQPSRAGQGMVMLWPSPLAPETRQAEEMGEGSKKIPEHSRALGNGASFRYFQESPGNPPGPQEPS